MAKSFRFTEGAVLQISRLRAERDLCAARLGAALLELRDLETSVRSSIDISQRAEAGIAESELRALGLDPDLERYAIADDGEVLVRRNGELVPVASEE